MDTNTRTQNLNTRLCFTLCLEAYCLLLFISRIACLIVVFCSKMNQPSLRENKSNNESIKTKSFSENEDQNHTDEDLILLSIGSNTSVTYNTNSQTSSLKTKRLLLVYNAILRCNIIMK